MVPIGETEKNGSLFVKRGGHKGLINPRKRRYYINLIVIKKKRSIQ